MTNKQKIKLIFMGTPDFAVPFLESLLVAENFDVAAVVTQPDRPSGRKQVLTPPPIKVLAQKNQLKIFQPEKLKNNPAITGELKKISPDLIIVVAFGQIIPPDILALPRRGAINVHPSLLPLYRGASPLPAAILNGDSKSGVTIMLMDEQMDHGPVVAQESLDISDIPKASELGERLARLGGDMLVGLIPKWVAGNLKACEQDHASATHCGKITKEDGLINLADDPEKNYRKIRAFDEWPRAYFFSERKGQKIRVVVKDARLEDGKLVITRVLPEGKKETDYADFQRS